MQANPTPAQPNPTLPQPNPTPAQATTSPGVTPGAAFLVVVVGLGFVLWGGFRDSSGCGSSAPAAPTQIELPVSATEMLDDYAKNEVAGDQKYKGKKLQVTGKINRIDSGIGDSPVVHLGTGSEMEFKSVVVHDLDKSDAAKLRKGDSLTVVCTGDGEIIGSRVLGKCRIK